MKLEQMYPNFLYLSDEEKIHFVAGYRKRREQDLATVTQVTTKSSVSKIDISPEELAILKSLGINMGDLKQLKKQESFETPEESASLFEDNTFAEGEEENA